MIAVWKIVKRRGYKEDRLVALAAQQLTAAVEAMREHSHSPIAFLDGPSLRI